MGMFDWIVGVPEMKCDCGKTLSDWQSKDGNCRLAEIHFNWVGKFYTSCDKCNKWWEFSRNSKFEGVNYKIPKDNTTIYDFTLIKKELK